MDIGGDLRRARTARHLSVAEISQRTKINGSLLRAIEDNRFDRVPPGLFTRGYLRAYAREVELDPETIVEWYRAEFEAPAAPAEPASEPAWEDDWQTLAMGEGRGVRQIAGLAVVLLISAAYFGFAHIGGPATVEGPKPTDTLQPASPVPTPTSTTGRLAAAPTAPMNLTVRTTGDCWVTVTVDGQRVFARLMKAGQRERFDVHDEATVHVGDPATFSYTLDGIAGRSLGPAGVPANLNVNRQTSQTLTPTGR